MEIVWMAVGAGVLGLVLWFKATKKRVRDAAYEEFAQMVAAIHAAQTDPKYMEMALDSVATYALRSADAQVHPSKLPADRGLMAGYWRDALVDARLIDSTGRRITDHPAPVAFWECVDRLRMELVRRSLTGGGSDVR